MQWCWVKSTHQQQCGACPGMPKVHVMMWTFRDKTGITHTLSSVLTSLWVISKISSASCETVCCNGVMQFGLSSVKIWEVPHLHDRERPIAVGDPECDMDMVACLSISWSWNIVGKGLCLAGIDRHTVFDMALEIATALIMPRPGNRDRRMTNIMLIC